MTTIFYPISILCSRLRRRELGGSSVFLEPEVRRRGSHDIRYILGTRSPLPGLGLSLIIQQPVSM